MFLHSIMFHWYSFFRCTLEGKRERKGYKELLNDPQLRYSGVYERLVHVVIIFLTFVESKVCDIHISI